MATISKSTLGGVSRVYDVDHDPEVVNTDAPSGSIIIQYDDTGSLPVFQQAFIKFSDGNNTDVKEIRTGAVYGGMFQRSNALYTTINTKDVWEDVLNFSAGELEETTFASSTLTTGASPTTYAINYSACIDDSTGVTYETAIEVDGVVRDESVACATIAVGSKPVSLSGDFILPIAANKTIKLVVRNITNTQNVLIINASVIIAKIR